MGIAANVALVLAGSWVKWVNSALAGGSTQASRGHAGRLGSLICTCWCSAPLRRDTPAGLLRLPEPAAHGLLRSPSASFARRIAPGNVQVCAFACFSAHMVRASTPLSRLHRLQVMLNYLVGGIVAMTGVMMASKFALDRWAQC